MAWLKNSLALNYWLWIILQIMREFYIKGGLQKANGLAYVFLMSFVPFFISLASIVTLFIPQRIFNRFENHVFTESLPIVGKQIAHYLQNFQMHALNLSIISISFLFITALLMIYTLRYNLDQLLGFNERDMHIGLKLILVVALFVGLIACGVVLLGIHEAIMLHLPKYNLRKYSFLFSLFQYFSSITAFILMYKFVPHTKVNLRDAAIAGCVTGVLFELAKFGFAIYIRTFTLGQNTLYGPLAAIPIFLLWLYIISVIFLLGAQIIATLFQIRDRVI